MDTRAGRGQFECRGRCYGLAGPERQGYSAEAGPRRCHHVCKANPISPGRNELQTFTNTKVRCGVSGCGRAKRTQFEANLNRRDAGGQTTEDRRQRAEAILRDTHDAIRMASHAKQSQCRGGWGENEDAMREQSQSVGAVAAPDSAGLWCRCDRWAEPIVPPGQAQGPEPSRGGLGSRPRSGRGQALRGNDKGGGRNPFVSRAACGMLWGS